MSFMLTELEQERTVISTFTIQLQYNFTIQLQYNLQ